ncbi:SDR family oxidoreductase [Mongoliibacter ruber]|uniref:Putative NAD(P)-binding protein n=1 Tax=Mongoliibacter ruber TaxID=1750599 RepID=A0A2T0WQR7_9BACT|nr:SDR family oxidoreductase [Mongoliibacter ruber]PRY89048.1 putative NAD(P)-binding protein [Mongoliibacter ruber]
MTNQKQQTLIIGAHGKTGQIVCDLLKDSKTYQPVAMIRNKDQEDFFQKKGIKTVLGDLEKDFDSAFEGIDRVVFAAGSGGSTGKDKTITVDQDGAKKSIEHAKKHGVQKYVMLSAMGTENPDPDSDIHHYLKAKHNADEYLKASGVHYTIVRPGALIDKSGSNKIEAAKHLNKKGEISRENVALTLVEVLESGVASNAYFDILDGSEPIAEAVSSF